MDLERARRKGISHSRLGTLTNPARALLWKLMLPYIEDIADNFDMVHRSVRGHDFRFADTEAHINKAVAQPSLAIRRTALQLDGLRKDIAANNHRLESIETQLRALPEPVRDDAMLAELREWLGALAQEVRAGHERPDSLEAGRLTVGRDGLVIVSGPHGHFMVWPNDLIGRLVSEGGVWEPHIRAAIERHARPDRTAIDAGAYIGLHTVHLSRYFREVYAFEPQRAVFQVLCGNLALNACRNVRALNDALYDRAGTMKLAQPEHQEVPIPMDAGTVDYGAIANAAALVFEDAEEGSGAVHARTIDAMRLSDVGFIKIDTQGADLHVMQGAANTIRRCRPVLTFEYERDMAATHGATQEAMLGFFEPLDYDVQVLHVTTPDRQIDYIAVPR